MNLHKNKLIHWQTNHLAYKITLKKRYLYKMVAKRAKKME